MSFTFSDLVEEVRTLPVDEMTELRDVIDRELIHNRREEILANHNEGVELWKQGKLTPSSDADKIVRRLLDDE
jgi:hypothetical protein